MSRKEQSGPRPITTRAAAWDLGYAEDRWHLDGFGRYLPREMIHTAVRHDPGLIVAFKSGAQAHTSDDQRPGRHNAPTPNPYPPEEVKS